MTSRRSKTSKEDAKARLAVIPRATLIRMIAEILPDKSCSKEARELFLACGTRFVQHMTTEALNICRKSKNRKIMPSHALAALDSVGFGEFREDVEASMRDYNMTAAKRRRKGTRLENLGVPLEELQRQQQDLIEQARRHQEEVALAKPEEMVPEEEAAMEVHDQQELS